MEPLQRFDEEEVDTAPDGTAPIRVTTELDRQLAASRDEGIGLPWRIESRLASTPHQSPVRSRSSRMDVRCGKETSWKSVLPLDVFVTLRPAEADDSRSYTVV